MAPNLPDLACGERVRAAVLSVWPAALCGASAPNAYEGGPAVDGPINVAVAHERRVTAPDGVEVTRMRHFEARVEWHLGPPRLHYDEAVIDVATERARPLDRIAVLAKAIGSRRIATSTATWKPP